VGSFLEQFVTVIIDVAECRRSEGGFHTAGEIRTAFVVPFLRGVAAPLSSSLPESPEPLRNDDL
jgi:hypothetical protein